MKSSILVNILIFSFTFFFSCDNNPAPNNNDPPCFNVFDTSSPSPYNSPIWHPDANIIGFNHIPLKNIIYKTGTSCVERYEFYFDSLGFWLINSDGTNQRRIFPSYLQTPAWSPDGEWIVFVLDAQIYKMRFTNSSFDTSSLIQLTFVGRNYFPAWSPDGQWIAFDSDNSSPNGMNFIWKMKNNGTEKRRIAYDPGMGEIRMPKWSPNGKLIVHTRYLFGVSSSEIYVMDTSGANAKRLTNNSSTEYYPQFSANSLHIIYTEINSKPNILIMDNDGTNLRQITSDGVETNQGVTFCWKPNGNEIVYTSYRSNDYAYSNGVLWIKDILSGTSRQLTFNR